MDLFISGFLLAATLCLDIGVNNVAAIRAGIERGFISSLMFAFGGTLGDAFYLMLSLIGVSYLLHYEVVRNVLWLGGTLILLWLAFTTFRSALKAKKVDFSDSNDNRAGPSLIRDLGYGFSLTLASPTTILLFATIGGGIIGTSVNQSEASLVPFYIGFFIAQILWSFFIAWISSYGGKLLGSRLLTFFSIIAAVLFLFFGVKIFLDGLHQV